MWNSYGRPETTGATPSGPPGRCCSRATTGPSRSATCACGRTRARSPGATEQKRLHPPLLRIARAKRALMSRWLLLSGRRAVLLLACVAGSGADAPPATPFPPVLNTQNPKDVPPTPQEALRKITVPAGFHVTLFAGEPDVQQPIAMALDDRGRLWVVENYTYSGRSYDKTWDGRFRDRILVFEDTDNDGRFDRRTVFWDQGQHLTSVALG